LLVMRLTPQMNVIPISSHRSRSRTAIIRSARE
jgi:hypothetical protein